MKTSIGKELARRKRRIKKRLAGVQGAGSAGPVLAGGNVHYEIGPRSSGIAAGGMGAVQLLVQKIGLVGNIQRRLFLLKIHLPYCEADHVLNIAYNLLVGGTRLEHIELRRQDEAFLDALGAARIPDPTTAGDFCRRFTAEDIETLMDAINETRLTVWRQQPDEFFDHAVIDGDGTIAETTGECKYGMDMAYNGQWGFHPLLISLANTAEPLFLVNRPGNRPSHEDAAGYFDRAIALCRRAGFRRITLRGDSDFSQTTQLDRWHDDGVRFVFGYDSVPKLVELADALPKTAWKRLRRTPKHMPRGPSRERPENVKQQIVRERGFENIELLREEVAEFTYRPTACRRGYRIVVVRKHQRVTRGTQHLFDKSPYFFYITNDLDALPEAIVEEANGRCNQENLIDQLKNGVRAMDMPLDNLVSNWAYMVCGSLAWSLKTWTALLLPEDGRWKKIRRQEKQTVLRMEFRAFVNAFIHQPCQITRSGRRLIYRLLSWNPWQTIFFRLLDRLYGGLKC